MPNKIQKFDLSKTSIVRLGSERLPDIENSIYSCIRLLSKGVGAKLADNQADNNEEFVYNNIIANHKDLSVHDIRKAFNMAINQTLPALSNEDYKHYGKITPQYTAKILNAYRDFKRKENLKALTQNENKELFYSLIHEKDYSPNELVRASYKSFLDGKEIIWRLEQINSAYDYLKESKKIRLSNETLERLKKKALIESKRYLQKRQKVKTPFDVIQDMNKYSGASEKEIYYGMIKKLIMLHLFCRWKKEKVCSNTL